MIIAGEASGDLHGSKVVSAMSAEHDALFFCGIGGDALRAAGVRILVDAAELAVVGITEVFANAKKLLGGMGAARQALRTLRPELLILIDFPDFNLRVARAAKKLGIPVLYYISPQVWAWRQGRVRKMRNLVDHMAVILPFEAAFYEKAGIPVTFVGHPLLDTALDPAEPADDEEDRRWPVIGLLPGSRSGEINRHLPVMLKAAGILSRHVPGVRFVLSAAPTADAEIISRMVEDLAGGIDIITETGHVGRVFERVSIVIAVSGTVTLEAAIAGIPMVVIYRVSLLTGLLARALIRVKHVCLANLIADRRIVPELLQRHASPEAIADKATDIVLDEAKRRKMAADLLGIRKQLGGSGASERVARIALGMLKGESSEARTSRGTEA